MLRSLLDGGYKPCGPATQAFAELAAYSAGAIVGNLPHALA